MYLLCGTGCIFRLVSVFEGLMLINTLDELSLLTVTSSRYTHCPVDRRAPVSSQYQRHVNCTDTPRCLNVTLETSKCVTRAILRLKFCEMLGQCDSEELAACGKFDCGNLLVYRLKVERHLCFFWPSNLNT